MLKQVMFALTIGFGMVVFSNSRVAAQAPATHDHAATPASPAGQSSHAGMNGMDGMHQKMMADMKAADEKLAALVATMNTAKGDAKVTALAQVVSELVVQHKAMHEHMGMMEMMMGGGGMNGGMMKK